jgi:tetratricopeptide (TPR) repeat protein
MLALASAAAMLGGCQSFPLTSWMFKDARPAPARPLQLQGDPALAVEEGKSFLRSGKISAAIASFRVARLDRASIAEANNGLAVAYSRLGRLDLARRYFQAAASLEPDNTKYGANLMRVEQNLQLASRLGGAQDLRVAAAKAAPARRPEGGAVRGPVVRISHAEVHVRGAQQPAPAPWMEVLAMHEEVTPAPAAASTGQLADEAAAVATVPQPEAPALLAESQPVTIVFDN